MTSRGLVLFGLMSVIWGIPYLFIRVAVAEVSPPVLVFARAAIAVVVLLPIAFRRGALAGLGLLCTAGGFVCFFSLIATAGPARATVITYIAPIVATLLGVLVLDERVTTSTAAARP